MLNIVGYDVYGTDVDVNAIKESLKRPASDLRIDRERYHMSVADGHKCPFADETFGHIFCFDSLHHMHDYNIVMTELYRVLIPGGRAIFVEPGSRHSSSPETIKFLEENKLGEWWIEKDVDLVNVGKISMSVGFSEMVVLPFLLPQMVSYNLHDWINFTKNTIAQQNLIIETRRFNYEDRVIFFLDKKCS